MANTLTLRLITPTERVFDGPCQYVTFKAAEGVITLTINQGEYISILRPGEIIIRINRQLSHTYICTEGVAHLNHDILTLTTGSLQLVDPSTT